VCKGLKEANKQDIVLVALEGIVDFIYRCANNDNKSVEIVKAAVGLVGDLAVVFGKRVLNVFKQPFVNTLIQEGLTEEDIRDTAAWAQKV
jgi:hypothetical protein